TGSVIIDGGTGVSTLTIDAANLPVQTPPGQVLAGGQTLSYAAVAQLFINNAIAVNASVAPDTPDRAPAFVGLTPADRAIQARYPAASVRSGSRAGRVGWRSPFPAGATSVPLAVVRGIEDRQEAYDLLLNTWFLSSLGRTVDPDTQQIFVSILANGESDEQVL